MVGRLVSEESRQRRRWLEAGSRDARGQPVVDDGTVVDGAVDLSLARNAVATGVESEIRTLNCPCSGSPSNVLLFRPKY